MWRLPRANEGAIEMEYYDMAYNITERKYNYRAALVTWLKERGDL